MQSTIRTLGNDAILAKTSCPPLFKIRQSKSDEKRASAIRNSGGLLRCAARRLRQWNFNLGCSCSAVIIGRIARAAGLSLPFEVLYRLFGFLGRFACAEVPRFLRLPLESFFREYNLYFPPLIFRITKLRSGSSNPPGSNPPAKIGGAC